MRDGSLNEKAALLRSFHEGPVLVLPNAWDAASAVLLAGAGARAIATTSGGVAWSFGYSDGQRISRQDMIEAIRRVVRSVDVPVTADVEGGYGHAPRDVAATVTATVDAGAVGINLEDSRAVGGPLYPVDEQASRIEAAGRAAADAGVPDLVVNARTDVYLFGVGDPAGRFDEVCTRAARYAEAGATCLFVPGLLDLDVLKSLAAACPLPLNAMAVPGGPSVADLESAGVRRVSVGTAIAQVAYGAAQRAARELLTSGTFASFDGAMDFFELNAMVDRAR